MTELQGTHPRKPDWVHYLCNGCDATFWAPWMPDNEERSLAWKDPREDSGGRCVRRSEAVADPLGDKVRDGQQRMPRGRTEGIRDEGSAVPVHPSQELGNADSEGSQGRNGSIEQSADEIPAWPPGPEGNWADVPTEFWPATQPVVRGMADGIRASWVDRLRALGNAVCPQQAELAIRDLLIRRTYQRGQ